MDYKKLIGRYRLYATRWENGEQLLLNVEMRIQDTLRDAADAIETILAERDAAIKSLHGVCVECKHHGSGLPHFPCNACSIRGTGLIDRWQWRGPQKEGCGDG